MGSEIKSNKIPPVGEKKYPMRSNEAVADYKGAREFGIEVTQWRYGSGPSDYVSLARIKSLEKDLPK